jgi:hypothetical protein
MNPLTIRPMQYTLLTLTALLLVPLAALHAGDAPNFNSIVVE